jgi:hypothetical protein
MSWTDFSFLYLGVNLVLLIVITRTGRHRWRPVIRTLLFASVFLLVFDSVAEHRGWWDFPRLLGVRLFAVPVENMAITIGTVLNSLVLYLFVDGRLRREGRKART